MKKLFLALGPAGITSVMLAFALLVAELALAQDRSVTVSEASVSLVKAELSFPSDGGCLVTVWVNALPDLQSPQPRAFNGARCNVVRNAALAAAKLDQGVGDGGLP